MLEGGMWLSLGTLMGSMGFADKEDQRDCLRQGELFGIIWTKKKEEQGR